MVPTSAVFHSTVLYSTCHQGPEHFLTIIANNRRVRVRMLLAGCEAAEETPPWKRYFHCDWSPCNERQTSASLLAHVGILPELGMLECIIIIAECFRTAVLKFFGDHVEPTLISIPTMAHSCLQYYFSSTFPHVKAPLRRGQSIDRLTLCASNDSENGTSIRLRWLARFAY